jgi:hypothetical protein
MSQSNDLNKLINTAETQIEAHAATARSNARRRHNLHGRWLLPVALFMIAAYLIYPALPKRLSPLATQAMLTQLLSETRESLNLSMADGNAPPPVLPNAALAAVVNYQVEGNSYRLSASMNGMLVQMDEKGDMRISGAAE